MCAGAFLPRRLPGHCHSPTRPHVFAVETQRRLTHEFTTRHHEVPDSGLGRAMLNLSSEAEASLERPLFELVKIRASQLNGCAYCIDMHTKDARLAGETEQRIYALNAWRETPFFTDRERAALEWTEAVTRVGDTHVPDEIHGRVAAQFDEAELVALTFAVVVINGWNRLAVSFRAPAGTYQPKSAAVQNAVVQSRAFKRQAHPQDLLGALVFLASSDSDFITGQTIAVDGGSVNT